MSEEYIKIKLDEKKKALIEGAKGAFEGEAFFDALEDAMTQAFSRAWLGVLRDTKPMVNQHLGDDLPRAVTVMCAAVLGKLSPEELLKTKKKDPGKEVEEIALEKIAAAILEKLPMSDSAMSG